DLGNQLRGWRGNVEGEDPLARRHHFGRAASTEVKYPMDQRALLRLNLPLRFPELQQRLEFSLRKGLWSRRRNLGREILRNRMDQFGKGGERACRKPDHPGRMAQRESLRRDIAEDQHDPEHHGRRDKRTDLAAEPEEKKRGGQTGSKNVAPLVEAD